MAKCGGCGKFIAAAECVRCTKCPGSYHPTCVGVTSTKVSPNWLCPIRKAKIPKMDNTATRVKGPSDGSSVVNMPSTVLSPHKSQPIALNQGVPLQSLSSLSETSLGQMTEPSELNVAYEIRCLREELSATRMELRQFREEISNLKADVSLCKQRMDVVEGKVTHLEKVFEEKEPSSSYQLEETISELKSQINDRDQDLLLNDVILTGIPETRDESPLHIIKLVSMKLGVQIDDRDIVNAERLGMVRRSFTVSGADDEAERPRPRALAVRLARRTTRDQLIRAARVRRGLTTVDLDMRGPTQRFFINERLTSTNSKLFFHAREAGHKLKFKYV